MNQLNRIYLIDIKENMNILIYIILFIIGTISGSIAEIISYRMPLKIKINKKSFCDSRQEKLRIIDKIPILSYFILKGKFRYCHTNIEKKKIILEIVLGISFVILGLFYNLKINTINIIKIIEMILGGIYLTYLATIITIDLKHKELNDQSIIFGTIISMFNIIFKYIYDKEFLINKFIIYMFLFVIIALISTVFAKKKNRHQYLFNNLFLILIMTFFLTEIPMILTITTTLLIIGIKNILTKIYKKDKKEKIPITAYIGISNYIVLLIIYMIENFR